MKKLILALALFASIGLAAQGTLKIDYKVVGDSIAQYDLSDGDTSWTIKTAGYHYSLRWNTVFNFKSITGTKDGVLAVYYSSDEGTSWIAYPDMATITVSANGAYGFDDIYTVYDKLKIVLTVNSITGGTVDVNERLVTNPKRN
jgi:hypothetical protein